MAFEWDSKAFQGVAGERVNLGRLKRSTHWLNFIRLRLLILFLLLLIKVEHYQLISNKMHRSSIAMPAKHRLLEQFQWLTMISTICFTIWINVAAFHWLVFGLVYDSLMVKSNRLNRCLIKFHNRQRIHLLNFQNTCRNCILTLLVWEWWKVHLLKILNKGLQNLWLLSKNIDSHVVLLLKLILVLVRPRVAHIDFVILAVEVECLPLTLAGIATHIPLFNYSNY